MRSHASVRSAYFQQLIADRLDGHGESLASFRPLWKEANIVALEWRRRATNRYDHATKTWSNPAVG